MKWYDFAFIAPACWAICNYLDSYDANIFLKDDERPESLLIFMGVTGLVVAILIYLFHPHQIFNISFHNALIVTLDGSLYLFGYIPYTYALREDDTSTVIPIYQTIPIFGFILGSLFLHEHLSAVQMIAGLLIILGAIFISIDFSQRVRLKHNILLLVLLSSFMLALYQFIFKFVTLESSFWITSFWTYLGVFLASVGMLVFSRKYRQDFVSMLRRATPGIVLLDAANEALNLGGELIASFALLLAPIAMVSVVINGLQPVYVFLLGILLTWIFPDKFKERVAKRDLVQKIVAIAIILVGVFLLRNSL